MSPREQIAAVLKRHSGFGLSPERDRTGHDCFCGYELSSKRRDELLGEYEAHVAGAVVEALGLTEEWAVRETYGNYRWLPQSESAARDRAERITKRFWKEYDGVPGAAMVEPKPVLERRWVSGWSVVGGEPSE